MPDLQVPGLERVDSRSETTTVPPFLRVKTVTVRYEHPATLDRLGPLLSPRAAGSPRSVFRSAIDILPRIPGGSPPTSVLDFATKLTTRQFGETLERDGLRAVEHVETESLAVAGDPVRRLEFAAAYPLASETAFDGPAEAGLAVTVLAGLWPVTSGFTIAGGIYPREDFPEVAARLGVPCRTSERLDPAPDRDRAWLLDLVGALAREESVSTLPWVQD